MEEDKTEELYISPTEGLNHDDWTEIHGWADQYIDWSFTTSPPQDINVWALDYGHYLEFISTGVSFGYHLSHSAADSGRFDVSSFAGQTWYIIFWNDDTGSQYTTVTYNSVFEGDPPPPNKTIFITKPDSTSNVILGSKFTIQWYTSGTTISQVDISIYKGIHNLGKISSGTNNDGSYEWTLSLYYPPRSGYRIQIKDKDSIVYNMSDYFDIISDSLTILEPNSNSSFTTGEPIEITWISNNLSEFLWILLYKLTDDGDLVGGVFDVPNTGYYYWNETNDLSSGRYFIRIYPQYGNIHDELIALDQSEYFIIVNGNGPSIPSYSLILILGISSLMSSILIYHHLNTRNYSKERERQ